MHLNKNHYRIGMGLYILAILVASTIPGKSLPKLIILSPDKLLHMAEYGILGFLAYKSFGKVYLPAIIGLILFAIFDEFWQSFVPGRFTSVFYVIADIIGFSLVTGTMYYLLRKNNDK